MKKIDIHCHTTDRKIKGKSASIETISECMKEYNIQKTVLLSTYFPHRGSGISNFRLLSWIKERPEFLLFGSLDFENYFNQGLNELDELGNLGYLSGVKVYTSYQNIELNSEKMDRLVDLSRSFRVPMVFHTGYSYSAMSSLGRIAVTDIVKTSDLEFLAKKNPDVNFIASHMSKPFLEDLIKTINRNSNIYTDMSGLIEGESSKEEKESLDEIKRFLGECGPSQFLFGTDFPVQSHKSSVYFIEESMKGFTESDKMDVYYNNAWRLLYGKI